jgi:hypothetical protein
MRRRQPPAPERVWTRRDMPEHLREFGAADWGCFILAQWEPEWQQAHAAYQQARRQWIEDHDVDVLAELRAESAERRARMRGVR